MKFDNNAKMNGNKKYIIFGHCGNKAKLLRHDYTFFHMYVKKRTEIFFCTIKAAQGYVI